MPLTRIKSLGITDGTITGDDINSTFNLTGKTVTLPSGTGGKVLQVITATDSTERSTTSSSYVTASNTLSVTITPSSTSNKILILASSAVDAASDNVGYYTIYKNGSTNLGATNGFAMSRNGNVNAAYNFGINYLDSPSTTSATTYQIYMKGDGTNVLLNRNNTKGSITCLEIAG